MTELERILDEGYLDNLTELATEDLRRMRAECEAQEEAVSYARRVLQGRLDILRVELVRRSEEGDERAEPLLALLPTILAGDQAQPTSPLQARATRLRVPDAAEDLEAEIDAIVDQADLDELSDQRSDELARLIDRLAEHEQHLSGLRRALFDRIDALREELAARYKDGRAAVRDLLSGT